jgi:hypothetical protein
VGFIVMPPPLTVALGQSAQFLIALATPAPLGGVTVNLASDNPTSVTITPSTVFIAFRATAPAIPPTVNGMGFGTANISASAPGFLVSNPTSVQVGATLSFSPQNFALNAGVPGTVSLVLSGPAPAAGLRVSLTSDNTGVVQVPAIVRFQPFTTTVSLPVFGVAPGSAVIHASAPGLASTSANVTVN